MPDRFDAVFFDLGGTLFSYRSFRQPMSEVICEAGRRLGSDLDPAALHHAFNLAGGRAAASVSQQCFYLHRDLFLNTYREFANALTGDDAKDEFLDWFYTEQRRTMIDHMQLRHDCVTTLQRLRASGHCVAIVSNIDDDFLEPMVTRSGLAACVDRWTSSEAAGSCKPDARFFRVCLEHAGHCAERVLFVGDSPVHDIAGARALGMTTVLIEEDGVPPPGQDGGTPGEPHFRIQQLSELLHIVDND